MEIFKIDDLSFTYPLSKRKALDSINMNIVKGEFLLLCGKSGCGKTTLLKHLKPVLKPHGDISGEIYYRNSNIKDITEIEEASRIGYVFQNPDSQIVTDKVWHELAFGLEGLGVDQKTIRLRVAEMASFFGIQEWFFRDVNTLSGGQKQLLNLASIMAMQPEVLILDEPTSQLDPIAATEFLDTIKKINNELGTTIIITEHRLEEVMPMSDRVVVLENGKIIADNKPDKIFRTLKDIDNELVVAMPCAMQVFVSVSNEIDSCPITVKEGRRFLESYLDTDKEYSIEEKQIDSMGKDIIRLKDVWFRYEKNLDDVIKDLNLTVKEKTIHAIVGGNGTGKTTTLSLISGILKPYRGKVLLNNIPVSKYKDSELFYNNLGVLPQNPQALFVKNNLKDDLFEMLEGSSIPKEEKEQKIVETAKLVEIENLLEMHPYDLSGGEQQRAALAKILLLNPKIILLDEPTKGLDGVFKEKLSNILRRLKNNGATILMVSHDIEFCSKYADYCSMFFDGNIVTTNNSHNFFSGNNFYTTAASRMSRNIIKNAVTTEDVIEVCKTS